MLQVEAAKVLRRFLPPLGPIGARKPAGPRGGDLGAIDRAGERS